jgi:hypothetical protein
LLHARYPTPWLVQSKTRAADLICPEPTRGPHAFTAKEIFMLGKIIGAVAGRKVARHIDGIGGPGGALLGVGAATLLRRIGPGGLIAAAAGSYLLKRHLDKREAQHADTTPRPAKTR